MTASAVHDSRPKVLMTVDAVGGVWQYAIDLASVLHDQVRITFAVLGPAPTADQRRRAEAAGVDLIVMDRPLDWTASCRDEVIEAGRAVAQLADRLNADIVHLNNPALAADATFHAPVLAVCHSCVATWWHAVRHEPLPEDFVWRAQMVRDGYAKASALLAPTQAFAEATKEAYGLAVSPRVVRNGRHTASARSYTDAEDFLFTAGRLWDDGKNLATLDSAATSIPAPVLAAGPLQGPNGTSTTCRHAISLGRISDADVAAYLARRPVFVSAAFYEPFGLAVLEAAQAGCALILSDIPTFRELWNGAALFVPPHDASALANAAQSLLNERSEREQLGEKARERAASYSVEVMGQGVLDVYRSLFPRAARHHPAEGAAA